MGLAERKPVVRVSVDEDVTWQAEAMAAKMRLMRAWKREGLSYHMAVLRYAEEAGLKLEQAWARVDEMEAVTGLKLERA